MRLIGLAVVLTLSLTLAPLAAEGQQAGKVYRIGALSDGANPASFAKTSSDSLGRPPASDVPEA
jgi:hypothetical protein